MRIPRTDTMANVRASALAAGLMPSEDHLRGHALWCERRESRRGSVDRLTARVVWAGHVPRPLARAWRTLAVAGPRGVLP